MQIIIKLISLREKNKFLVFARENSLVANNGCLNNSIIIKNISEINYNKVVDFISKNKLGTILTL